MSEITQNNLYLILPFKVSRLVDMLCADEHISKIEAIRRVYSSAMYKELEQESTKRWHEGPASLYQTITPPRGCGRQILDVKPDDILKF